MREGIKNWTKKPRRTSVTKFASASGLSYSETDPTGRFWAVHDTHFPYLLGAENVLSGRWQGLPVTEADFSELVMTRSPHPVGMEGHGHLDLFGLRNQRFSALVADLPADLSDLMIQRRMHEIDLPVGAYQGWLVLLTRGHALRYHVESGSTEFDHMFRVTTENTTFAAKLIDASMIKWLQSAGPPFIRLHGRHLVLVWGSLLPASELATIFDTAKSFTDHIPRQFSSVQPGPTLLGRVQDPLT